MELINYNIAGNFPGKTEMAIGDVSDMQKKIIYTEIWHCFSVSCGALIAVVILMILVTAGIFVVQQSWLFLMSSTSSLAFMTYRNPQAISKCTDSFTLNASQEMENQLSRTIETKSTHIEPWKLARIREESCYHSKEKPCFSSKDVCLPSSVVDASNGLSKIHKIYDDTKDSGIYSMQEYSMSSSNLPIVSPEDINEHSQTANLNCEEKVLMTNDENSHILNYEENVLMTNDENSHILNCEENVLMTNDENSRMLNYEENVGMTNGENSRMMNYEENVRMTNGENSRMMNYEENVRMTNDENIPMLNYEENALNTANKDSIIDEENISLSRKCKPQQETQISDRKYESKDYDDNSPINEIESNGNENIGTSSTCQTGKLTGTNIEADLSPEEENETNSENLDLAPERKLSGRLSFSTERLDNRVKLDDELAQFHLNCLLNFDSDDDDDVTVTDSDMTIPKVPNDHENSDEQYCRKQQGVSFYNNQNQQFQKGCSVLKDNDMNKNKQSISKLNYENFDTKFNSIESGISQYEDMNDPVCSYNSSRFSNQVQPVSCITNAYSCKNLESTNLNHSGRNADITVSFCLESQRNPQDPISSFRFKEMRSNSLEKPCFQSSDCDQESYYQKIHDKVETSIVEHKEMKQIPEQKDKAFSLDDSMVLSTCKPNNDSLFPDMPPDHFEMESFITLEYENQFETGYLLPLSSALSMLREAHISKDTNRLQIVGDLFGTLKMSKRDVKLVAFTSKLGNNGYKHKGKKSRTAYTQRQRYGILMGHCRRFFNRLSRYRWKRCIKDVISSNHINIYHHYNGRNRCMNEGTVFMNNEQAPPSEFRNREPSSNASTGTHETESYSILPSGSLSSYFQRISEQQTMSTVEKMQFEWMRLQSFASFPSRSGVSPLLLAKWGYFATGNGDEAMTFCCQQKYRNWQSGDDPQAIHRRQSPSCSFVLGIDSRNIPVHGQTQQSNSLRASVQESAPQYGPNRLPNGIVPISQSIPSRTNIAEATTSTAGSATGARIPAGPVTSTPSGAALSTPVPPQQLDQHAVRANQSPAYFSATNSLSAANTTGQNRSNGSGGDPPNRGSAAGSSNDSLGICFDKPRYPNYAVLAVRISSFTRWPSVLSQSPREMSLAGFFYAGYGDYVRCFFCGGGLRNWDSGDDPWVEHARWFSRCAFVRQNRGEAFVDLVLRRHAELEEQENQTSQQLQHTVDHTAQHSAADDMSTPAAKSIMEMGFPEDTVRAAIVKFKKERPQGRANLNATELLEFILNEQQLQGESVNSSRPEAHVSTEPQETPGPSNQATPNTREETEATATSNEQASAATPKTKEQKSKSDKKKKKKEKAAEKKQSEEQEKASPKTTEQKKEENQPQATIPSSAVGVEARSESFSSLRVPDSLDQMTLEEVRSLQEENAQLREQTLCKICMDKNVSMAFLPCGHLACCEDCAPAMRTCPICRQLVKGTVKTYLV